MSILETIVALAVVITALVGLFTFGRVTRNRSESARVRWSLFALSIAALVWMGMSFSLRSSAGPDTLKVVVRFLAVGVFIAAAVNITLAKTKERENAQTG